MFYETGLVDDHGSKNVKTTRRINSVDNRCNHGSKNEKCDLLIRDVIETFGMSNQTGFFDPVSVVLSIEFSKVRQVKVKPSNVTCVFVL